MYQGVFHLLQDTSVNLDVIPVNYYIDILTLFPGNIPHQLGRDFKEQRKRQHHYLSHAVDKIVGYTFQRMTITFGRAENFV